MGFYSGIDLHSTNNYLGVSNEEDKRLYKKKLPNDLDTILAALAPFREELVGVVVESTFNWYWLVDGLMDNGYKVHLANPSAIKQYEGLKYRNDKWDSFWLAHMLRLKILPEGYIYPKEDRPVRDLLRRRLLLVRHRTAHLLSLQSMINRNLGIHMSGNQIKKLKDMDAQEVFEHPYLVMAAKSSISVMEFLKEKIMLVEKEVTPRIKIRDEFKCLQTIPGIGNILALTIMLEVGDIRRFAKVGNYSSYCRCVKSERISNDKKKGEGNQKNGNKYLSWAYIEAANFARRHCKYAQRFHQRKEAKTNGVIATKALSNKIARASYYIMRDQVEYDPRKLFG
jgi:transposase